MKISLIFIQIFHYIWFIDSENSGFILILKERMTRFWQAPHRTVISWGRLLEEMLYLIYLAVDVVNFIIDWNVFSSEEYLVRPKKSSLVSGNWLCEIFYHLPTRKANMYQYISCLSRKKTHTNTNIHTNKKQKKKNQQKTKKKREKQKKPKKKRNKMLLWTVSLKNLTRYVCRIRRYAGFPQANLFVWIAFFLIGQ